MKKENEVLKKELKQVREMSKNATLNTSMVSVAIGKDTNLRLIEGAEDDQNSEIIRLTKENAKLKRYKQEVCFFLSDT